VQDLTEAMKEAAASLERLIEVRASDGEFDEADIRATLADIGAVEDALNCELEKIEEARSAAGSHSADKTSERI